MATAKSDIVTAIDAANPAIINSGKYLGKVLRIPFFLDASALLLNNGDVVSLTKALPGGCYASAIGICTDGTNGVAASSTAAIKSGTTVLTTSATVTTATDTNGAFNVYALKHTDVSGTVITLTVGGADWSDTVDMYGYIDVVMDG